MSTQEDTNTTDQKTLTKEQKRLLFEAYTTADTEHEDCKKRLEDLAKVRSEKVKAIFDACGKGPFSYNGDVVKIVSRGDTFFFRGKTNKEVEEI